MSLSFVWKVEPLGTYDLKGRQLVRVHETYEGEVPDGVENRHFDMPGLVSEAFIRARRDQVERQMKTLGHTKNEPIDWSFLRDLKETKQ